MIRPQLRVGEQRKRHKKERHARALNSASQRPVPVVCRQIHTAEMQKGQTHHGKRAKHDDARVDDAALHQLRTYW